MPPLLTVQRFLKGSGHEWGGLYTEIINHHPKAEIELLYLDMIPWFCRVYIHTLTVENGIFSSTMSPLFIVILIAVIIRFDFSRVFL